MKFGIRIPSLRKRIAARTSWKRFFRHNLGFKAPRGWGWLTNPRKAAYNRVYNRTTISVDRLFTGGRSRGSRRGSGGGIGILALAVGVLAAAAFAVYVVVAAAVALIIWIVALATKKSASTSPAPALVTATGPSAASLPSSQYLEIIPVDPAVFEDPTLAEATALKTFAAWAAQIPKAPRDASNLVRGLELRTRVIGRLTTQLEGRRVAWRSQPYGGRDPVGAPPLDAASIDAWQPPPDLRGKSRYVASCPTCTGDGKVTCTSCGGSSRRTCGACNGAGKYDGTAANGARRVLNCKTCRGKGDVACGDCTRGRVECPVCHKLKKLECWLEIDTSRREDVQIEPDGEVTVAFAWGQDGAQATQEEIVRDAKVLASVELPRVFAVGDLPDVVPENWTRDCWERIQAHVEPSEHVVSQRFTLLELPNIEVRYGLSAHEQSIAFEGRRMLAPPIEIDEVLFHRARALGRSKILLALLPLAAATAYASRGDYFTTGRAAPFVGGIIFAAAVMAILGYVGLWYATLRRRAGRKWALGTLVPAAAIAVLAIFAEPRQARARAAIDGDDLVAAREELNALGSLGDANLAPLWADVHLKETLASKACADAALSAHLIDEKLPQRHPAQDYADGLARSEADAAIKSERYDDATTALKCGSDAQWAGLAGKALRARIAIGEAQACQASQNWSCAIDKAKQGADLGMPSEAEAIHTGVVHALQDQSDAAISAANTEKDLSHRVSREHDALAAWAAFAAVAALAPRSDPQTVVTLRQHTAKDEQALAKQEKADQAKRDADEKKRKAAEERQRQREDAAEKRQMSEPQDLLCCDGSISPSCSCGGPHRGCCSHHGGICGCR